MKRKGISLIVLIITIIVLMILAAAIILSMTKSNPIKNAKKAVEENDVKVVQEAVIAWISDRWAQEKDGTIGKEAGAYYTGKITKESSDVEVNLDGDLSMIQVTLEDLGLEMLEEVEIEKNVVKSIKKDGEKQNIGNITPGGGEVPTPTIPEDKIMIDKSEYENLNSTILQMQERIKELEENESGELCILEEGTFDTGTIQYHGVKQFTISCKNTYTEEDDARIIICDAGIWSGQYAFYFSASDTVFNIVGNSVSFYIWNGSGSGSRKCNIKLSNHWKEAIIEKIARKNKDYFRRSGNFKEFV